MINLRGTAAQNAATLHASKRFDLESIEATARGFVRRHLRATMHAAADGTETIGGLTVGDVDKALEAAGMRVNPAFDPASASNQRCIAIKLALQRAGVMISGH